jgi:hypothetical protein
MAGWRYLAAWIDLFRSRVLGWMLYCRMNAVLVIAGSLSARSSCPVK